MSHWPLGVSVYCGRIFSYAVSSGRWATTSFTRLASSVIFPPEGRPMTYFSGFGSSRLSHSPSIWPPLVSRKTSAAAGEASIARQAPPANAAKYVHIIPKVAAGEDRGPIAWFSCWRRFRSSAVLFRGR